MIIATQPQPTAVAVQVADPGSFRYHDTERRCDCRANFPLFLIRAAWRKGCDFEAEADGYGPGRGTMGDWSGIRDSSMRATSAMLEKAVAYLDLA